MSGFGSVCKQTLVFVLLTLGTTLFVPVPALANGVINVTTPLNGATVTVPFDVHFTYSGTDTYTKLWIDGVAIISDHNGSTFDYTVTSLAAGQHTLSLQAHDSASNTTVTVQETITVSSAPPPPTLTVTPSTPTMAEGDQLLFTASVSGSNVPATWQVAASGDGTIPPACGTTATASCTFTAGTVSGKATLTATDGSGDVGQAMITVVPLAITPSSPNVAVGQSVTLNANALVTWGVTGDGTIPLTCTTTASTSCVFTANSTGTQATITATEASPAGLSTNAVVTLGPLMLTPQTATTVENQTQIFTANAPIPSGNWTADCGNIVASASDPTSATFTAPSSIPTPNPCTISATDAGSATAQASDTVTDPPPPSGLNYTTWKNDNEHTGQQPSETTLTPSNVNSSTFGLKFSDTVDGDVYAQPLYLSNLTINGTTHNVVFVATEHDSVYAFDADVAGSPLWQTSFLTGGATTASPSSVHSTIGTEIGITGTPVIDLNGVPNPVLYVVAETDEGGTYIHRLHALDVTTGKEISGSPVPITASGFSSKQQLQRPALILANGNVYVSFGSEGDNTPWHGWIFGFETGSLSKTPVVWNSSVSGSAGGIWGGGGGLSADSDGNIYAATGNGSWNGTSEYSMSWVKLSPDLKVQDFWTPYNEASLSSGDGDLGSGAPVLVSIPSVTAHPNELIGCGKPTPVYVVNRDTMGGYHSGSDSQIIQSLPSVVGGGTSSQRQYKDHCFMTPAYFNGKVYFIGNNDVIKAFTLDPTTGLLSTSPTSKGSFTFLFPGGQPVTSSNGSSDGIVWAVDYNSYDLHAYDASNLTTELYRSSSLDFTKWMVPTVINGKVYVGSKKKLSVFGLF
jgi:hypothetical protein